VGTFYSRNKPYTELSVGLDNLGLENSSCCVLIMRSYQNGFKGDGVVLDLNS
jgi:hypothetical protein